MASIALIDDDETEALIISGFLELGANDHTLMHYPSMTAFLSGLNDTCPDLILLDRRIPPVASFAQSLEQIEKTGWTGPVVLLTASDDRSAQVSSTALTLIGPIEKGDMLSTEDIEAVITKALNSAQV